MKIQSNLIWIYYINEDAAANLEAEKVGKWMYFFKDSDFAEKICKEAVENDIVAESKHSNAEDGVCCFYLNCDDTAAHKRCITYFLYHNLIRRTKTGKLYNISFKFDSQTNNGEYGSKFHSEIKLSDFLDLETGKWIKEG